jgi:serine phosphatase RsbU (regulator of sigma subunit)/PAS domain-containing protein
MRVACNHVNTGCTCRDREGSVTLAAATGGDDVARLMAVIRRQRRELDEARAQAAARSVVDLARGMLMEQLSCSPAEAAEQLSHLSSESGTTVAELAAQITGQNAPPATGSTRGEPVSSPAAAPRVGLARAAAESAPDGAGIAAALLEEALAPVGAAAVALWLMEPDGGLVLAGQAGFDPDEASRWRRVHPEMRVPALLAARDGTECWWPRGRPATEDAPVIGRCPDGARVVLPLRGHRAAVGAVEICWPQPQRSFPAAVRRQLAALAEVAGQALGAGLPDADLEAGYRQSWVLGLLDGLSESVLVAGAVRDDDGQLTDFRIDHLSDGFRDPAGRTAAELAGRPLLEVYPAMALADALFDRAQQVLATGQPQHIPAKIVTGQFPDVPAAPMMEIRIARLFDSVVIAWRRADEAERLAAMLEHAQRLGRLGGWEENLISGQLSWTDPTFALFGLQPGAAIQLADLHTRVPADDLPELERFRDTLLGEKRQAAAVFRIVRADDGAVRQLRAFAEPVTDPAGTLVALRGAYQDVSADYNAQVAFAATRERLADAEVRAEEDRLLALRLQQAITPRSAQPVEAGLDVAVRYRPAGPGTLVSGDWYDTALLPNKDVLLVVGDIAGHGLSAVNGMVTMRNSLRGLAITGAGPAALLGWLNSMACHMTDGIVGTVICGIYNPPSRTLRWARAGHLPPILVRDGKARLLTLPRGLLLGADPDTSFRELRTSLRLGDTLVLFTDGLVERRDQAIDDALDSLLEIAARPGADIAEYADRLLANGSSDTDDDACLVAVHIR